MAMADELLQFIVTREHEHRDQMDELDLFHNQEKEKMADHIEDLERHIKKLEAKIIEKDGVVDTTDAPRLDISEMKPIRIVAYR